MRREEFKYRTGFIAGAVVILIGLALQLIVGPLNWEVFSSPVNFIALVVLCLLIAQTYALRKRFAAASFLMKRQAAVPCLVYVTLLTALMGLIRQVLPTKSLRILWDFRACSRSGPLCLYISG